MKKLYGKISRTLYLRLGALFCFIGDIILCSFIYERFTSKALYDQTWQILQLGFEKAGQTIPADMKEGMYELLVQTTTLTIAMVIIFHLIMYTMFIFEKRSGHLYVKILSYVGTLGAALMTLNYITHFYFYGTLFLIQTALFFFVAYGTRVYPHVPDYAKKAAQTT